MKKKSPRSSCIWKQPACLIWLNRWQVLTHYVEAKESEKGRKPFFFFLLIHSGRRTRVRVRLSTQIRMKILVIKNAQSVTNINVVEFSSQAGRTRWTVLTAEGNRALCCHQDPRLLAGTDMCSGGAGVQRARQEVTLSLLVSSHSRLFHNIHKWRRNSYLMGMFQSWGILWFLRECRNRQLISFYKFPTTLLLEQCCIMKRLLLS